MELAGYSMPSFIHFPPDDAGVFIAQKVDKISCSMGLFRTFELRVLTVINCPIYGC